MRHGPYKLLAGVSLAAALIAAAHRPYVPARPHVLLLQPDGLPAAGVSVWCYWHDSDTGGKRNLPNTRTRGTSDREGRLYFVEDPPACMRFRGDGVHLLPEQAPLDAKEPARIRVIPEQRCTSALVAVEHQASFILTWFRPHHGYSRVVVTDSGGLAAAVNALWADEGEHHHEEDMARDCAWLAAAERFGELERAVAGLTRPMRWTWGDHQVPALQVSASSVEALCAWLDPAPPALSAALLALGECTPRPPSAASSR